MKKIILFVLLMFSTLLYGENMKVKNDIDVIKLVSEAKSVLVLHYSAPYELLYPEECKILKDLFQKNPSIAINYLEGDFQDDLKIFVIDIITYEESVENYSEFLKQATETMIQKKCSEKILKHLFFGQYAYNLVVDNYKNENIQLSIDLILHSSIINDDTKRDFENLKRGILYRKKRFNRIKKKVGFISET